MPHVPAPKHSRSSHRLRKRTSHDYDAAYAAISGGATRAAEQSSQDEVGLAPVIVGPGTPVVTLDYEAPDTPTALSLTSDVGEDADGRSVLRLIVTLTQPPQEDLFASYVEVTADNDGNPDPALIAPVWTNPLTLIIGREATDGAIEGVRGVTQYWARCYATDVTGNRSEMSSEVSVTTGKDTQAPGQPQNFVTAAGFRGFGAHWDAAVVPDLMFYEIRYAPDDGTTTAPDTNSWTVLRLRTNTVWVDNLTIDQLYWAQVRAVDFSGNVEDSTWDITGVAATDVITTSADHGLSVDDPVRLSGLTGGTGLSEATTYYVLTVPAANTLTLSATVGGATLDFSTDVTAGAMERYPNIVDYIEFPELGYTALQSFTPSAIGAADVAFNSVLTNILASNEIDASTITTGVLRIDTGTVGKADGLRIFDGAVMVGYWDETGLYIGDATAGLPLTGADVLGDLSASDYIHLTDAGLTVYLAGSATSAITPDGINASAILFGNLPGGHNLLKNSSFELADFAAAASTATWDVQADWTATELSATNATNGANSITMTAVAY